MTAYVDRAALRVDPVLADFIEAQALPGTGIAPVTFWDGLSDLIHTMGPKNRALLEKRAQLQEQIDGWHVANRGKDHDAAAYKAFLTEIGYLVPEGPDFAIETENVDPEIAAVPTRGGAVYTMRFTALMRWARCRQRAATTQITGRRPSRGGASILMRSHLWPMDLGRISRGLVSPTVCSRLP